MMKTAISFKNLSFAYPDGEAVLNNVTFSVHEGEFVLLSGLTGSGKTTLLKHTRPELKPAGKRSGNVEYGTSVSFVMQNPENQIVMDTCFDELCFGLENNGWDPAAIRRRVAEISAFFGLEDMMDVPTCELSGGEKQLLSLAAAVALQPGLLVLDEPTCMLDPVASHAFWEMIKVLNRELGIAVLVSEHSLDEILSLCDRAILLKDQTIRIDSPPRAFAGKLIDEGLFEMLPEAAKLTSHLGVKGDLPLNVREAREILSGTTIVSVEDKTGHLLAETLDEHSAGVLDVNPVDHHILSDKILDKGCETVSEPSSEVPGKHSDALCDPGSVILFGSDLWFSYGNSDHLALMGASFSLKRSEIHALVGGNGSGKSTLLRLFAGLDRPLRGKIIVQGKTALLPQDPKAMFWNNELGEDLLSLAEKFEKGRDDVRLAMESLNLTHLEKHHPYDLSAGEMCQAALAKLLLTDADILLLDEPTKGLDAFQKSRIKRLFTKLKEDGKSIVLVTHDLAFAASISTRCTMLSRGKTVCCEETSRFFKGNYFYTTDVNRITHSCVTWEEASRES